MAGSVAIVIVNYRTADLATACLASIARQAGDIPGLRVVVADNASGDGSAEKLEQAIERWRWTDWASVLPLERNGGFAFGNNAAIRTVLASPGGFDYVMLLNPDTVCGSGAIRALVEFMDSHPQAGITGSRLENTDGAAGCSAHNAPSPLGELESSAGLGLLSRALRRYAVSPPVRQEAHECHWVSGASLMVRREVFEQVGFLDEGFFLYFEEVDFCVRARAAGWEVWFVPGSRVVHLEGASTGVHGAGRRRPGYWYDSRRRFFVKHFGVGGLVLADALWALGRVVFLLRRSLQPEALRASGDPRRFALDLLWGDLRSILTGSAGRIEREGRRR